MTETINWIAVDWGTTHLRAYAMSKHHAVIAEAHSSDGMGTLPSDAFEAALLGLLEPWLPASGKMRVLACGMVGAKQGWVEAAYRDVPCALSVDQTLTPIKTQDARLDVRILPGLCQRSPADVMRGEETQIAGLLAEQGAGISTVCLPGTHSKWVSLGEGHLQSFSTFMTGELFALLSTQSILRHSVRHEAAADAWDVEAFQAAVREGAAQPEQLLSNSFRIRAQGVLQETAAATARARLSGLLIGSELAGAERYWSRQSVALIGDTVLSAHYATALEALGIETQRYGSKEMTVAGLRQQMISLLVEEA